MFDAALGCPLPTTNVQVFKNVSGTYRRMQARKAGTTSYCPDDTKLTPIVL
jgi:hypothetical protein